MNSFVYSVNYQDNYIQIPFTGHIIIKKKLEIEELIDVLKKERLPSIMKSYKEIRKIKKISLHWYESKISKDVIENIILQHHPRCQLRFFPRMYTHIYNDGELVPKNGATVKETCVLLRKYKKLYAQKRSKCIQLIKNYNGKKLGHILLSQVPITSFKRLKNMSWNSRSLIHLDGFHRILSLYYPKKIDFDYVNCFLASPDENLAK